jgi:hypothetical protein
VLYVFAYSHEFGNFLKSIFGLDTSRPENNLVNDFYRGILGRFPDSSGYNAWLGVMRNAQCTGGQQVRNLSEQVTSFFTNSAEYAQRSRSNSQYVEDMYDAILRRGPDASGFAAWVNTLDTGQLTRNGLLDLFVNSGEFQGRVQQVINTVCVH